MPLKVVEAQSARDALAKAIYAKLFDYIVFRVNQSLPFSSSKSYIGVLDIAGFGLFLPVTVICLLLNYCVCFEVTLLSNGLFTGLYELLHGIF